MGLEPTIFIGTEKISILNPINFCNERITYMHIVNYTHHIWHGMSGKVFVVKEVNAKGYVQLPGNLLTRTAVKK